MQLAYLWDLLEENEQIILMELRGVQGAQTRRDQFPRPMQMALANRESALVKELNQLKRLRLETRMRHAVVAVVHGGQA